MRILYALCFALLMGAYAQSSFAHAQGVFGRGYPFFSNGSQSNQPQFRGEQEEATPQGFDRRYVRTVVPYQTQEAPGTIIVDSRHFYLYFVQGSGTAIRYGIGVAREGFGWNDVVEVGAKRKWPEWHPPRVMIARELRKNPNWLQDNFFLQDAHGDWYMLGLPGNPLGARALYLYKNGRDTQYRIHGTWDPTTIGTNVSSGCIRMRNADVYDLYQRVKIGAKVIVK